MSSSSKVVLAAMICAIVVATTTTTTTMAQESPDDYVNAHNSAREAVGVGPVSWNDTLEAYAEDYAKNLIADCKVIRSGGPYGENIFFGDAGEDWTAQKAVDSWVDEKQYYDYDTNTCASGKECGEYTQVVWADSTNIGCALVVCDDDGGVIIICNYYPPGDVEGEKPYFLG